MKVTANEQIAENLAKDLAGVYCRLGKVDPGTVMTVQVVLLAELKAAEEREWKRLHALAEKCLVRGLTMRSFLEMAQEGRAPVEEKKRGGRR